MRTSEFNRSTLGMAMAAIALAGGLGAGGCMRIDRADPTALASIGDTPDLSGEPWAAPDAWPERLASYPGLRRATAAGVPAAQRPRGVIREVPGPLVPMSHDAGVVEQLQREASDDIAMLTARYRLREGGTLRVSGEGQGAYLFLTDPDPAARRMAADNSTQIWLKFVSGRPQGMAVAQGLPGAVPSDGGVPTVLRVALQRTWMVVSEPAPGVQARGLAVIIPGLFGTPANVVEGLTERLREHGWAVLTLLSQPSRFTEQITFEVDQANPAQSAQEIADELTDRAAECAYAVQAACLWLKERRPALAAGPRVVIGLSGGAMVAPTVVARDPGAYSGAVLIAGGVNFLRVALDSNYSSWVDSLHFRTTDGRELGEGLKDRLEFEYLTRAPLDSQHTARALRGKPLLIIHGSGDRAVPAVLGDRLWVLTGRPERWVFDTGHELLFAMLPMQLNRLMDWLDEHEVGAVTGE